MGQYNDFDLDIRTVQAQNNNLTGLPYEAKDNGDGVVTGSIQVCPARASDTCYASCGWLLTSCSAHCR